MSNYDDNFTSSSSSSSLGLWILSFSMRYLRMRRLVLRIECGLGLIEAGALQGFDDQFALELVHRITQRPRTAQDIFLERGGLIRRAHARRQIAQRHGFLRSQNRQALDQILQLANVTRPRIGREKIDNLRGQRLGGDRMFLGFEAQEMVEQQDNIVTAFAQRRQEQRNHIEPVEQIRAELGVFGHLLQITVTRRDDAHVHFDFVRAAETAERLLFDGAQKLRLDADVEFTDLVEEKRAAMGEFETADLSSATRW